MMNLLTQEPITRPLNGGSAYESTDFDDLETDDFPYCKTIHIVEGPAGSGKSYQITQQHQALPEGLSRFVGSSFHQHSKTRFDFSEKAPANSLITDTTKIIEALTSPAAWVFVDRFYISQLIYQVIRNHGRSCLMNDFSYYHSALITLLNFESFIFGVETELNRRGSQAVSAFKLELTLVVPPWEVVQQRRMSNDREYPFCELDWHLYNSLAKSLEELEVATPFPIHILRD